jgi:hypothetical protein
MPRLPRPVVAHRHQVTGNSDQPGDGSPLSALSPQVAAERVNHAVHGAFDSAMCQTRSDNVATA